MTQSEKALEKQEKCHQNWCASTRNAGAQSVTWRQQQRLPVPAGARERLQLGLTPGSTCRSWAQSKRSLQADPTLLQSRVLFQLWCLSPALVHRQCNLRVKPLNSVATQPQPSTYRLHYSAKSPPQDRFWIAACNAAAAAPQAPCTCSTPCSTAAHGSTA